MDDVTGPEQESGAVGDSPLDMDTPAALQGIEQPKVKAAEPVEHPDAAESTGGNLVGKFLRWCVLKEERTGLHDWFMVIFTGVLTLVAIFQGIIVFQNSQSSTVQMERVINAANRIDDAADSFSRSSADISRGISDAVTKLGQQATSANDTLNEVRKTTAKTNQTRIATSLPLIMPTNLVPIPIYRPDGTTAIKQEWTNLGDTRAIHVVFEWGMGQVMPSTHPVYVRDKPFRNDRNVPLEELTRLNNINATLYVYGRITYDDVFPIDTGHERRDHLVEYCV